MKTRTLYMIPVVGLLVLAGVFFNAHPPLAQTDDPCPLPEGVAPPPDPAVTAQQVEDRQRQPQGLRAGHKRYKQAGFPRS